jgi:hypothetical protein
MTSIERFHAAQAELDVIESLPNSVPAEVVREKVAGLTKVIMECKPLARSNDPDRRLG